MRRLTLDEVAKVSDRSRGDNRPEFFDSSVRESVQISADFVDLS